MDPLLSRPLVALLPPTMAFPKSAHTLLPPIYTIAFDRRLPPFASAAIPACPSTRVSAVTDEAGPSIMCPPLGGEHGQFPLKSTDAIDDASTPESGLIAELFIIKAVFG